MFLIDANVFMVVLKGHTALGHWLANLSHPHLDHTIYIEVLQGSKSHAEKRVIKKFLNVFPCLWLTPEIGRLALQLIDSYSNSHGLLLGDALIAASAFEHKLRLITYNTKDFQFISNLTVGMPPFPPI